MNKTVGTMEAGLGSRVLGKIKGFFREYAIIYAVLALIVILSFASPNFFQVSNFVNVLRQISMIAILAVGIFFVMVGAGIDISIGAIVGLTGVLFAMFMVNYGIPPVLAFVFTALVGLGIGIVNGLMVAKLSIPAMIATLATQSVCRGMTYVITGAYPISGLPEEVSFLGRGYVGGLEWLPWPVFIMVIVAVLAHIVSERTKFGRSVYAIGGNPEAAHLSGIKHKKVEITTYVICGGLAALAGMILTSRMDSGQPNGGLTWEFEAITAAVIGGVSITGGRGKVLGALLGAILVGLLTNGMTLLNVNSYYQQVVKGVVMVVAIAFDVYSVKRKQKR